MRAISASQCRHHHGARGFTLLEMVIALALLGVLAGMAAPMLKLSAQREKEAVLRAALRDIRSGLDAYKQAVTDGHIRVAADASGYPEQLTQLVQGVPDVMDANGKRLYFMRRLPRDPLDGREDVPPEQTWGLRSYASPPDAPSEGRDVFDVYSRAPGVGLNGVPYRQW